MFERERVLKEIEDLYGDTDEIMKRLSLTREEFYSWFDKYPEVVEAIDKAREKITDLAEKVVLDLANKGNVEAKRFLERHVGEANLSLRQQICFMKMI